MTSKRPDHVRSVPIIALPGCIVAVDARVEMENFSMVVAKLADSWVRGGRFSMRTGRRSCVSETGVVGVDPAVCYPYNNARGVPSQRPVGVVVKRTVLKERCGLPVSGMGFEDGFHPKDPVNAQNGLENLEVRRGHRERAWEVSRDVQRRRQDGQAKLIQVKSDCFHTAVREARFEENSVVSSSACGIQAESKFSWPLAIYEVALNSINH